MSYAAIPSTGTVPSSSVLEENHKESKINNLEPPQSIIPRTSLLPLHTFKYTTTQDLSCPFCQTQNPCWPARRQVGQLEVTQAATSASRGEDRPLKSRRRQTSPHTTGRTWAASRPSAWGSEPAGACQRRPRESCEPGAGGGAYARLCQPWRRGRTGSSTLRS